MEVGRGLKILLDTNILFEVFLNRAKAGEVRALLSLVNVHEFFLSDFSLHSVGVVLFRMKRHHAYKRFIQDMIVNAGINIISLDKTEVDDIIKATEDYGLGFDDAYQYAIAKKYGLPIVSFDSDFDRCDCGRKIPSMFLSH